jgi:hypothetical protein
MADGLNNEEFYRRAYADEACKNAEIHERYLRMEREVKSLRVKYKEQKDKGDNLTKALENEK